MSKPLRLVQFSDCHLFGDPTGLLRGVASLPSLQATIAAARARVGQWDATLLTGDLVQDDVGGYAHVRATFGALGTPVYCLPGNHDVPGALSRELADPPFHTDGHVRIGDWLVVMLDSCIAGSADGEVGAGELARLDQLLGAHRSAHALVCLHHHPVAMGSGWLDRVGLRNPAEFFSVLDAHPCVRGVVWGHVHQAAEGRHGPIRLYATPSTCAQFKPRIDGFAVDDRPPAYRWFDLRADGSIDSAVEWVTAATESVRTRAAI